MADNYYVISSFQTVRVMTGNTVLDAEFVTCATLPTQIGFAYAVPLDSWTTDAGPALLAEIATALEELVSENHVVAGDAVQNLDDTGLISDAVDVIVEYDRTAQGLPPLQGTVNVPLTNLFDQETGIGGFKVPGVATPANLVDAEYNRLVALAAG